MLLISLKRRDRQPEIMDQPGLDVEFHRTALHGLERINWLCGSARILWPDLSRLARKLNGPMSVLDIGSGAGDVPIALAKRAQRQRLPIRFTGFDISETAVAYARQAAARAGVSVLFQRLDVLEQGIAGQFDAVMCSLFLHHLEERPAHRLLERMRTAARHLALVNDLERSRTGYLLALVGCRLLSRSPVVHVDGPRSVRAAFSPSEALALATKAGWVEATIERRFPCRYLLRWSRP